MIIANPHFISSPSFTQLYIGGAGGFAREVAWLIEQSWGGTLESFFVVTQPEFLSGPVNNINCRLLSELSATNKSRYVVAIGEPDIKRKVSTLFEQSGHAAAILIHPRAEASQWLRIGEGTIICAGVMITVNVAIGKHVHINLGCTIGHDVEIGDYSTLSPGVNVSGNVKIGSGVFIGTGASIINGTCDQPLMIGNNAVIAAGACVTKSVAPDSMVAGVPAVKKR
jgi:sugar O-acyltransferase (sialic acid O-acetyltransferase NeuD family)